jgi:tyrosine-protein phosphatase SIW14
MKFAVPFFVAATLCFAADPQHLANFHQVNDHIYRGAQPPAEGIGELAKLGIKTVIDLRESGDRSESEKKSVEAAGMRYLSFPMAAFGAPAEEVVVKLLTLFEDSNSGPIFVHCRRGADRTGTIIAVYRIVHDHWENAKALAEAKAFGMSWTERAMQSYIVHYHASNSAPASSVATQNQ